MADNAAITVGSAEPLGAALDRAGCNFAVYSEHATAIEVCLFDEGGERRFVLPGRSGAVFHGHIPGVRDGARYGLRAHGLFDPSQGQRFDPTKLLIDPYALELDGPIKLNEAMMPAHSGETGALVPKAIVRSAPPLAVRKPLTPWAGTVIYETSVKALTRTHPDIPPSIQGTFAALSHPAIIKHLTDLGVTTLELLPCMAWMDERHLPPLGLSNAWGYNSIGWCAPDPRLAPGGWPEVAAATKALAEAGIETILDVVYNHSGESDELGPTISLRGLDNASYYRLRPDNPALYDNDAGCGDILRAEHPAVVRLVLDSLRLWAQAGGFAGFRFDLAPVLGRYADGFDPKHPLLTAIGQDPVLRDLKLIAEPWDIGPGGFQLGKFPPVWGEWNSFVRADIRRFWRGDSGMAGALATRLAGSEDIFANKRLPSRSINYVVCHDGFTLADLTAYAYKHNEANGEQNRDGTDDNSSWNHGVEGIADDPAVDAARKADQRALLTLLLAARGTPMLSMGSEFGQSQAGNNNAYAQDNALFWMDWQEANKSLAAYAAAAIKLRKAHPALHADRFLSGAPFDESLLPDVAWLTADGKPMQGETWAHARFLTAVFAAPTEDGADRAAVVVNRDERAELVILPPSREGFGWTLALGSLSGRHEPLILDHDEFEIGPRAVAICVETRRKDARSRGLSGATLERLSRAAGVAQTWNDLDGGCHEVPPETLRACLTAMGLPTDSEGSARDSLADLAGRRGRRAMPAAWIATPHQAVNLPLAAAPGVEPRGGLVIEDEAGRLIETALSLQGRDGGLGEDGRPYESRLAGLPPLAEGRYRVWRTDAPDTVCNLVVAPGACFLPQPLGRRFGLGAQLYSLRRTGDQGMGDLSTLALLAEKAAAEGCAFVGFNPLHMLFPQDRERASPYHPSDRLFLDPMHIDVSAIGASANASRERLIDYPAVWRGKEAALEAAWPHADRTALDLYLKAGGEALRRFCLFQAIAETQGGKPWMQWPAPLRRPDGAAADAFAVKHADRLRHHAWRQMLAEGQLAQAAARGQVKGLKFGLYGDLALGAAIDGAEVWANPERVCTGVSIGAPPDPFGPQGQIWMLPPPNPLTREAEGCADFAQLLTANMKHAGMLRIDHVLGLARLFWVPDGASGAEGTYVAQPQDMLLAQLALESQRHRCVVIGEDLGLAQPGLRETLAARDVLSYRVIHFEREGAGFAPPDHYPVKALACVSTHDLPTFEGWKSGEDIKERAALGLVSEADTEHAQANRAGDVAAMREALGGHLDLPAAHAFVARSNAALVQAQLDDLAGETVGVNLPGTDKERPNWRRRLDLPVETLLSSDIARPVLEVLRAERPPAP